MFRILLWTFCLLSGSLLGQPISFQDSVYEAAPYRVRNLDPVIQFELDQVNNRPFSPSQKRTFLQNYRREAEYFKRTSGFGNTYFENEKAAYPHCMHSMIFGLGRNDPAFVTPAKNFMQDEAIYDLGSDLTDRVDLFPSFTLKGQVPKYFYFGEFAGILDSAYRAKMRNAMYLWTHQDGQPTDPMLRPNPYFVGNTGCWDVRCRNSWVDTRNTDNLKAMRETSAYLFSEEIDNATIRSVYHNRLRNHVGALWNVGYSEWDSETYFSHSFGPFFNLFAYTRSVPMKRIAKAGLDWYMTAASVKYFQAMSTGPSKRSNGGSNIRLGAEACDVPYLYFGDEAVPEAENQDRDRDSYIQFLSGYRPPQAMRQLARKEMRLPVELRNTKPPYGSFVPTSANRPESFETMFMGRTFQMGSVVTAAPVGDMRPFKMGAWHPSRGVDVFYANTTDDDSLLTHAKYAGDQIAQHGELLIWLRKNPDRSFFFQVPGDIPFDSSGGVWFWTFARTWVALRPIHIQIDQIQTLSGDYSQHLYYHARPVPGGLLGFAMEVGEEGDYSDFFAFRDSVLARSSRFSVDEDSLIVRLPGSKGKELKMRYNPSTLLPFVSRNQGPVFDYQNAANFNTYQSFTPPECRLVGIQHDGFQTLQIQAEARDTLWGPVFQNWKSGLLKVLSRDHYFEGRYDWTSGSYSWIDEDATPARRKGRIVRLEVYADGNPIYTTFDSIQLSQDQHLLNLPFSLSGTFSFRIRVVDEEGNEAWSSPQILTVTSLRKRGEALSFSVFPNPAEAEVRIEGLNEAPTGIDLIDPAGRVYSLEYQWANGGLRCPLPSEMRGVLGLRVRTPTSQRTVKLVRH